jgi:hypothetical protein
MSTKFGLLSFDEAQKRGYIPVQTFVDGIRIKYPFIGDLVL